jgi:cell division protein FtsI/penicillin-binding protein 2
MTVDIRLQMRAREILERHLRQARVADGALVVMEAGTGDVIAAVSAPVANPPAMRAAPPLRTNCWIAHATASIHRVRHSNW